MATTPAVPNFREIAEFFDMYSDFFQGTAYGSGHINDMVRTATSTTCEDDVNLANLNIPLDRFDAIVRDYLSAAKCSLKTAEVSNLSFSGKFFTLECGTRFLTDYLLGDVYFKIKHPTHNLDRCRNKFAFVGVIDAKFPEMEQIVQTHCPAEKMEPAFC